MPLYWLCYRHHNQISVVIEPGASLIHARLRASLDQDEFTEGHELDRKWQVPMTPSPPGEKATGRQSGKAGAGIGERRYGAELGPANMFNRHFGGRPSIAFTRHM
jgi:hypothetical protein